MRNYVDNETFDKLEWRGIDPERMDEAFTGAEVLGVDPVGEPGRPADGVIFNMRAANGATVSVCVSNDPCAWDEGDNPFLTEMAVVPIQSDPRGRDIVLSPEIKAQIEASIERWYNNLTRSE